MESKSILIVDDEPDLCEILKFNLETAGFNTEIAFSGEEAINKNLNNFNLILLDVMMPGMSGFDLAKKIRSLGLNIPLIFLTAKDTETDTLEGFSVGADDYIKKPFSVKEVVARINAVLNRSEKDIEKLVYNGLIINLTNKTLQIDNQNVEFTKTELDLLIFLLKNKGTIFSRKELITAVWPQNVIVSDRTVDVNLARIRKKIGQYANNIVARHGYGYCFETSN